MCNANGTYNVKLFVDLGDWNPAKDGLVPAMNISSSVAAAQINGTAATTDDILAASGIVMINNIPAGAAPTITVNVLNNPATAAINESLLSCPRTYAIVAPCVCPVVANQAATACDGAAASTTVAAWKTAVQTANASVTPASIIYTTTLAVNNTAAPAAADVTTAANVATACANEVKTEYAYVACADGADADAFPDSYILLGTYTLTISHKPQTPTIASTCAPNCSITLQAACPGDVLSGTGIVANVFTASAGAAAVTVAVTVTPAATNVCAAAPFNIATPACCPALPAASPAAVIVNSTCTVIGGTPAGGSIAAPATACPTGSTLQYSTDGIAWSATLPTYTQAGPAQTIWTRCNCTADPAKSSTPASVTTAPGVCPIVCSPNAAGTFGTGN
jgi:hypothetical protein